MSLLLLSRDDVVAVLRTDEMLVALADGFRALSSGQAEVPGRTRVVVPGGGALLTMPAFIPGLPIGIKMVSVFEANHGTDVPSHQALICLFDAVNGSPAALMDGTFITAVRTAGSAMLAIDHSLKPGARTATVVGSGVQAEAHATMLLDRCAEVRIHGRNSEATNDLVARVGGGALHEVDLEAGVRAADVVCLCTHGNEPVIASEWVQPGTVVTSVGFAPPGYEVPLDLLDRAASIIVESRVAFEPAPVGCTELAGRSMDNGMELGEVLLGRRSPRTSPSDIVIYKSMGHAVEDVATASMVYARALAEGRGQRLDW